jgi:hypothetical protein
MSIITLPVMTNSTNLHVEAARPPRRSCTCMQRIGFAGQERFLE